MRKFFIFFVFYFSIVSFSQEKKGTFELYGKKNDYKYLDYSAYGGYQLTLFITSDVNEYLKVYNNSKSKLSNYYDIYHSYYFFLLIPEYVKTKTQKEYYLFEFIKSITDSYNNNEMLINLFMDEDYSEMLKIKNSEIIFQEVRFHIGKSHNEFYDSLIKGFQWQNEK